MHHHTYRKEVRIMLKLKKMATTFLVCCLLGTSISSLPVLAAENTTSSTISSNTEITDDNLKDVLDYVGLNEEDFIADESVTNGVTTVKELEEAIAVINRSQSTVPKATTQYCTDRGRASGTKTMTETFDNDAYTIDVTVSAGYSGKSWTGVYGVSASVDSAQLVITYKIDSQNMSATYTSSVVTASGTVYVQAYVGVGNLGLIKVGDPQSNKLRVNFYASNYL